MSDALLLGVDGLSVHVGTLALLRDVSFKLHAGEVLTLLGESGAGKSLLVQAVMGNLPAALRASGSVTLNGVVSQASDHHARRPRWGRSIACLPQEPALALDPLRRMLPQVVEVHHWVRGTNRAAATTAGEADLHTLGLSAAGSLYPWQLSGGMAQRAAAAIALAGGAGVLLADEPTKGLDAHWRAHTVAMLQSVQRAGGALVVVTHDLRVAEALGGQLIVLASGEVVEAGEAREILANPQHRFTQQLVAAHPAHWKKRKPCASGAQVVTARGLGKGYGGRALFEGVNLDVNAGERLVIQGPSGSGKSTLGNVLLGLTLPDSGQVKRATGLASTALQKLYQDPVATFAPRLPLVHALRDVAARHRVAWAHVVQRLNRLGIAEAMLARRPAEISGGELQRVALARVLMVRPALLFADEPTSRLDALSQQTALSVMLDAADETGAALVLVTHDDDIAAAVGTMCIRLGRAE